MCIFTHIYIYILCVYKGLLVELFYTLVGWDLFYITFHGSIWSLSATSKPGQYVWESIEACPYNGV